MKSHCEIFFFLKKGIMSKPFQAISDVINTSGSKSSQSFNDIYGEPENFLEIEVS